MADRSLNPDLWMVTAGPRQPLKGVFFNPEVFIPKFFAFGRTFKAFTPCQLCDCRSKLLIS